MHDQHDDLLERELSRLSEYTGEPTQTPLWQQAIDAHRRKHQQRLWVWVRRPAPALAAAGLAILVASVAMRSPIAAYRNRELATSAFDADRHVKLETARDSATKSKEPVPSPELALRNENDVFKNSNENVFSNARVNDLQNNELGLRENVQLNDMAGTSAPPLPTAPEGIANLAAGKPDVTRARGAGAEAGSGAGAGGGGGAAGGRGANVGGTVLAGAVEPMGFKSEVGVDGHYRYVRATGISSVPEPSANLALAVPDLKAFYKQLPSLVDVKLGEQVIAQPQPGEESKIPAQEVNLTLRVKEDRLSAVMDELKKAGRVQAQSGQTLAKETRLQQIDVLVEAEKQAALKAEAAQRQYADKETRVTPVEQDEDRKRAAGAIEALNRRRAQIEQGGELATLNIVAVPDSPPPAPAPSTPLATASGAPTRAAPSLPSSPSTEPAPSAPPAGPVALGGSSPDKATPVTAEPSSPTGAMPTVAGTPTVDTSEPVEKAKKTEAEFTRKHTSKADAGQGTKDTAANKDQLGDTAARGKDFGVTPPPGAQPALPLPPADLAVSTDSTKALQPSSPAPRLAPAAPPPRPTAAVDPAPAARRADASTSAPAPGSGGKIQQAAREGWSSLGDTTANFVRSAIGSMLYWLPALIAISAAIVWWRRRAAAAAQEPPPE